MKAPNDWSPKSNFFEGLQATGSPKVTFLKSPNDRSPKSNFFEGLQATGPPKVTFLKSPNYRSPKSNFFEGLRATVPPKSDFLKVSKRPVPQLSAKMGARLESCLWNPTRLTQVMTTFRSEVLKLRTKKITFFCTAGALVVITV